MKIPAYFKRDIYIEKIKPYIDTRIIKVIAGQRRVGKSFLLYQLMDEIRLTKPDADIIYINKELFEFDAIKDYTNLIRYVEEKRKNKGETCYLFIDEIQDIDYFEKALRSFFAESGYDIYCTGSNANLLSGELASYLSGRYIEFKVHGFNYAEFLKFHELKDSNESLSKFYRFGGLPYLTNLPFDEQIISGYLKGIYSTIVLKDVVDRYNVRNVRQLEDLISYLADTVGSLFSANRISAYLKSQRINIQPKVILDYLGFLTNSFLIQNVKPADIQGKKIFRIGEKYYFEDLGIRHCIRPFKASDIGKVLENIVCQHLQVKGYQLFVGRDAGKEIDFIAEKDGERIYIQVAATLLEEKTREREFGNLLSIPDNYPKFVVTLDELEGVSHKGINQIPVRRFLLDNLF